MPSKGKLNQALERVQGVDHYLDKQKKLRKAAEKKKRTKEAEKAVSEAEAEEEEEEEEEQEINGAASSLIDDEAEDSEEEESDDEDGNTTFDLERINDTDSSSDGEDNLTEAKLPTMQKAKPIHGKSKRQRAQEEEEEALKAGGPVKEHEDSEQDSDADNIPLSDIESLDEEDREDVVPFQRLTINNISALQAAHKRIALDIPNLAFSIHQSVTTAQPVVIEEIDDDLKRELAFYSQSLSAVKEARIRLKAEEIAFTRPVDYFAEMVKSDEHMGRVKAKLVDEAAGKKAAAEARKQRDLKKFGKQVQVAKGQERDKAKRETLEKIKVLKRKRGDELPTSTHEPDLFDVELEDSAVTEKKDREARKRDGKPGTGGRDAGNTKRRKKDEKYGFGGKKRFGKSGDAESSADMRGFSVKKMKAGGKKRPGKDKRAKGRS